MGAKHAAKGMMRSAKNFTKGYTDIEVKVREATSNDPIGPSGTIMSEIASASHHQVMFLEIMAILDKRLNDKGKNWRHVYKALVVLDYLLHCGSEQVIAYSQENLFIVKTLQQFQYIDEHGRDFGLSVRQKSKELVGLLENPEQLLEERANPGKMHEVYGSRGLQDPLGYDLAGPSDGLYRRGSHSTSDVPNRHASEEGARRTPRTRSQDSLGAQEERDLKLAIEESKRLAELQDRERSVSEEELRLALERSRTELGSGTSKPRSDMEDLMELFEGPPAEPSSQVGDPQGDLYGLETLDPYQASGSQQGALAYSTSGSYPGQPYPPYPQGYPYPVGGAQGPPSLGYPPGSFPYPPSGMNPMMPGGGAGIQTPYQTGYPPQPPAPGTAQTSWTSVVTDPTQHQVNSAKDPFAELAKQAKVNATRPERETQASSGTKLGTLQSRQGANGMPSRADEGSFAEAERKYPPISSLHSVTAPDRSGLIPTSIPPNAIPTPFTTAATASLDPSSGRPSIPTVPEFGEYQAHTNPSPTPPDRDDTRAYRTSTLHPSYPVRSTYSESPSDSLI